MRRVAGLAVVLCTLLAGCDSAPTPSQLIGDWAILDHAPAGSKEDNCASDFAVSFERDGRYGGYYESGNWSLNSGSLLITVNASNYESSGESPEVPLIPPKQHKWQIMELSGPVAYVKTPDSKFWLYRCEAMG